MLYLIILVLILISVLALIPYLRSKKINNKLNYEYPDDANTLEFLENL